MKKRGTVPDYLHSSEYIREGRDHGSPSDQEFMGKRVGSRVEVSGNHF